MEIFCRPVSCSVHEAFEALAQTGKIKKQTRSLWVLVKMCGNILKVRLEHERKGELRLRERERVGGRETEGERERERDRETERERGQSWPGR